MALYFRKSVRVGPFRFNLSKSGVGVSAGIPGFRVGTGPRGHYVHAGMGGVYYRRSLSAAPARGRSARPSAVELAPSRQLSSTEIETDPTVGPHVEIDSGSAFAMADETAQELLDELSAKQRVRRTAPGVSVILLLAGLYLALGADIIPLILPLWATAVVWLILSQWDALRRTTVIMYDLTPEASGLFEQLVEGLTSVGSAQRLWHIAGTADVYDPKYHAGASSNVRRTRTEVKTALPPQLTCNIDVPSIAVGRQTLYFFPDRMLVFDSEGVGAVPYQELVARRDTTRFIESEAVSDDAKVVAHTWRYVNKSGGPDLRFNGNHQIPICMYETLHLTSAGGLNELLYASRVGAADSFVRALLKARREVRMARAQSPHSQVGPKRR